MDLIDVDDIGAQAAQQILDLFADARLAGIAKWLAIFPVDPNFGGDDDVLSLSAFRKRLADDFFRMAEAIDRRSIDDIDAAIERALNGADRVHIITPAPHPSADRPCSERDARGRELSSGNVDRFEHLGHCSILPSLIEEEVCQNLRP